MDIARENIERLVAEARRALGSGEWAAARRHAEAACWLAPDDEGARSVLREALVMALTPAAPAPVDEGAEPTSHAHPHDLPSILAEAARVLGPVPRAGERLDDLTMHRITHGALALANSDLLRGRAPAASFADLEEAWGPDGAAAFQAAAAVAFLRPHTTQVQRDALGTFSLTVALLTDLDTRESGDADLDGFLAGMLHTVGLLALDAYCPDGVAEVRALAGSRRRRVQDREAVVFSLTNSQVAAHLAAHWGCPPTVVGAIAAQGIRDREQLDARALSRSLIRARMYARARGLHDGMEASPAPPSTGAWPPEHFQREIDRFGGWEAYQREIAGLYEEMRLISGAATRG